MEKNIIEDLMSNIQKMANTDYHINCGIDRRAFSKLVEKNGQKRTYLSINCYTLAGKFKGSYRCGYVDMETNTYVCSQYDDVNALEMEYIGR